VEPFQLICSSCTAKLKVTRATAIGQKLGCPKCGVMLLVEAPPGHIVPSQSSSTGGSFEEMDIDSLLSNGEKKPAARSTSKLPAAAPRVNAPAPRQRPKNAAVKPAGTKKSPLPTADVPGGRTPQPRSQQVRPGQGSQRRVNPNTAAAAPTAQAGPLVPDQAWVNPEAKKRQKLVLIVASIVGGLLILTAVGLGVFLGAPSNPPVVINDVDPKAPANDKPVDVADNPVPDAGALNKEPKVTEAATTETADTPPLTEPTDAPPTVDAPASPPKVDVTPPPLGSNKRPTEIESEATNPKVPDPGTPAGESEKAEKVPETIEAILELNGNSILQVKDAAEFARDRNSTGQPKYFVEKRPFDVEVEKQKQQIVPRVGYKNVSLQVALSELSSVTGLTFSVETPLFQSASISPNPELNFLLEDEKTEVVIKQLASKVGAVATSTATGYVLAPDADANRVLQSIDVGLPAADKAARLALEQLIRNLIYPESWSTGAAGGVEGNTLQFKDGDLEILAPVSVIRECQDFIKVYAELRTGAEPLGNHEALIPFADLSKGKFAQEFKSYNAVRVPISQWLANVEKNYGLTVMCDWNRLQQQSGWTSQAMAPSRMTEETVGDAISEIAHSLGAAVLVVNDSTVWLTTFDTATSIFYVKCYPLKRIGKARLTGRQVLEIVREALGREMTLPGTVVQLLADDAWFAVRAPQSVHRQIDAVLRAVEKPAANSSPLP